MGWTEDEFLGQRWEFISQLLIYLEEKNKRQHGQ